MANLAMLHKLLNTPMKHFDRLFQTAESSLLPFKCIVSQLKHEDTVR